MIIITDVRVCWCDVHTAQTQPEIVANLSHGIPNVVKALNKGWKSVQALHIKTPDSVALPLYNAQPNDEEDLKLLDSSSSSASKNSKNGKRRKKEQQEATDVEVTNADVDISPQTKRTRRKKKPAAAH